ncbi:MAG: pyridoxal phosphate-dependent aminotransferase [Bdellovibrionales bacterium]|nr:pyridoxal phosphate-dependent aminotransferase [Oligoflexia bacterium]
MSAQPARRENLKLPRNRGLPEGISLLRKFSARVKPGTLNLGLGKPEVDMPDSIRALAKTSLLDSKLDYTENAGDASIRNLLASQLAISSGKQIILSHGAQEALMAALVATLSPGDEVLIPDPGFLSYAPIIKTLGGKAVPYRLRKQSGAYVHDLLEIKKKLSTRTRAIIVSSPGNPTGCDLAPEEVRALLTLIDKKRIVILSDEVYGMLHFTRTYQPLACLDERIVSLNSFSKSHALTGWRIGFIACENVKLLQSCLIAHQYIATCASVPSQRLLGLLLSSALFKRIPSDYRVQYQSKLDLFRSESGETMRMKITLACGGFYLFPELPKKQKSMEFCEQLLDQQDVLTIPGSAFGKQGEGSIRLSLALPDKQIVKAAKLLSLYY